MIDDDQIWGEEEIENFKPPDEVIEQVLTMTEVAIDYPEIYEQALRMKKEKEQQNDTDTDFGD